MKREVLCRPFRPEQVKQRPGQNGKLLSYVETHAIIARLNEGCDAWDFVIERYEILDEEVVVLGRLVVDGTVIKTAFGGSAITRDRDGRAVSVADDLKAAGSDALKKAASLLGVGLELYSGAANRPERASSAQRLPSPLPMSERPTSKQLSAIESAARRKNIRRDRLLGMLEQRFQKKELAQLSRREASQLIGELSEANGALA